MISWFSQLKKVKTMVTLNTMNIKMYEPKNWERDVNAS
jgi:hypothetical protein